MIREACSRLGIHLLGSVTVAAAECIPSVMALLKPCHYLMTCRLTEDAFSCRHFLNKADVSEVRLDGLCDPV